MSRTDTIKKTLLEKRLAFYVQQIEAANDQLLGQLSAAEKLSTQQQINNLLADMQRVDDELTALENVEKTPAHHLHAFKTHLPHIDFRQPHQHVERVLRNIEQTTGGAALFFLQKSYLMGGEWFVQRIKDMLKSSSSRFRECPVRVSEDMCRDEFGIMSRLAQHFGISLNADAMDWRQGAARIVERLCEQDFIRSKDVVFIEIHEWNELDSPDSVLQKFIDGFWKPLIRQLPAIAQYEYEYFKLIAFITVEDEIPCGCLSSSVCRRVEDFRPEHALELQLSPWTSDDVRELCQYSRQTRTAIDHMAAKIHSRNKDGIPRYVWTSVEDELRKIERREHRP